MVARETVVMIVVTVVVAFMVAVVGGRKLSPARLPREGHQGHPSHVERGEKSGEQTDPARENAHVVAGKKRMLVV